MNILRIKGQANALPNSLFAIYRAAVGVLIRKTARPGKKTVPHPLKQSFVNLFRKSKYRNLAFIKLLLIYMEAIYETKLLIGRKLGYFHNRVVNIYAEKGYKNIPFEHEKRREMVRDCAKELTVLFEKVFIDKDMASHLLDKFYDNSGNVLAFFCDLDNKNMDAILTRNW